jgi:F-type H+-transporting ATPase subunit a
MLNVKKLLGLAMALPFAAPAAFASTEGVKPMAEALFNFGPLPVTNSMVTSWIVAAALVIAIRLAVRRPQLIPSRPQALVESLVQGIFDLISPIVGSKVAKPAFPLLIALFTFILIQNWSGLFPGVGTIYMVDHETGGWMELIRPGNADMNATLALAAVAFIAWFYLIMRYAGPVFVLKDIFGNKADKNEIPAVIYYPLFVIFFLVGIIEVISIVFRPISLSLRLFGNVFGGESLMHAMSGMQKWGLPTPFYFLELMIGFVQAFVCNHGDDHAPGGTHAAESHH